MFPTQVVPIRRAAVCQDPSVSEARWQQMTVLSIVSPLSCQRLYFQPADVGRYQGPGEFSMSPLKVSTKQEHKIRKDNFTHKNLLWHYYKQTSLSLSLTIFLNHWSIPQGVLNITSKFRWHLQSPCSQFCRTCLNYLDTGWRCWRPVKGETGLLRLSVQEWLQEPWFAQLSSSHLQTQSHSLDLARKYFANIVKI